MWTKIRRKEKKEENKQANLVSKEVVLLGNLLVKQENPGTFSIPCQIGNRKFEHAMLDLGSAINIMSTPIYADFQSHILYPADIIVQLADHSLVGQLV